MYDLLYTEFTHKDPYQALNGWPLAPTDFVIEPIFHRLF